MALAIINSTRGSHPRVCNRAPEGRPERAVALSDSEVVYYDGVLWRSRQCRGEDSTDKDGPRRYAVVPVL